MSLWLFQFIYIVILYLVLIYPSCGQSLLPLLADALPSTNNSPFCMPALYFWWILLLLVCVWYKASLWTRDWPWTYSSSPTLAYPVLGLLAYTTTRICSLFCFHDTYIVLSFFYILFHPSHGLLCIFCHAYIYNIYRYVLHRRNYVRYLSFWVWHLSLNLIFSCYIYFPAVEFHCVYAPHSFTHSSLGDFCGGPMPCE